VNSIGATKGRNLNHDDAKSRLAGRHAAAPAKHFQQNDVPQSTSLTSRTRRIEAISRLGFFNLEMGHPGFLGMGQAGHQPRPAGLLPDWQLLRTRNEREALAMDVPAHQ